MALKPSMSSKGLLVNPSLPPGGRRQLKIRALAAFLAAVLLIITACQQGTPIQPTSASPRHVRAPRMRAAATPLPAASESFTLQFEVCNGFTNQRIALLSGLVLAAEANRSMVLPDFLLNGMQPDGIETVTADKADSVPFGAWFDEQERTKCVGTSVVCAGALVKQHQELLRAAADGLVPSKRFRAHISARRHRMEAKSGATAYNLIHLRVEKDWFALCKWWHKPELGRDNCMNNTDTVGEQLQLQRFQTRVPIVVVTSFPDAVPEALETALASIKASGYIAVLGSELVQPGEVLTREESALVDYYLGLEADKFTGNSVSTFTAFLILERQWLGRHSAHYNGGAIPLSLFFPLF